MSADDVVCSGARPLFFLDYLAVGRLLPERVAAIVAGVAEGCRLAGCALVGGETAEHPGVMADDQFDLAGFCVGVVELGDLIDGSAAEPGDAVIGLPASGLHANGYSLVRRLLASGHLELTDELLEPTRIYAPAVLAFRQALRAARHDLHGVAHVTGGGLPGNLPRAVGPELAVRVDPSRWETPPLMARIARIAAMDGPELRATFNAGIGMAIVVPPGAVSVVQTVARDAVVIGEVLPVAETAGSRYVEAAIA
jgi:phosphoribosylformylglycinamidine cyclo-ligase